MAIFITGSTGYLGSYVVTRLLDAHTDPLILLVRAKSVHEAKRKLWKSMQLHMDFTRFSEQLDKRCTIELGDITEPRCGLDAQAFERTTRATDSIIHVAAALNRRSDRVCQDVNLRGTLEVIEVARAAKAAGGLRRFSHVSTTAVAGERSGEVVREDDSIDFSRRDYDPYARTKKFAEHMVDKLLPDVPVTVFRPASVIGDSRFAPTTQFDMIRAVIMLARLRVLPLHGASRHDIVPANYVGRAIADIHQLAAPKHRIYHLSAGLGSETHAAMMDKLRLHGRPLPHRFVPGLEKPFGTLMDAMASSPRKLGLSNLGSLMQVFWPYVVFDTVFDNSRVVEELGEAPAAFGDYGSRTIDFAVDNNFEYPYLPWPEMPSRAEVVSSRG